MAKESGSPGRLQEEVEQAKPMEQDRLIIKGMHPYTYGANSGVAYGNQAIDPTGNPTMPGAMHRWHIGQGQQAYGYGQPRY